MLFGNEWFVQLEETVYDLPVYVWALELIGVIGIPSTALALGYRSATQAGVRPRRAAAGVGTAALLWGGWVAGAAVLAGFGAFRQEPDSPQAWVGVAAGTALLATLLAFRLPPVTRILDISSSPARLIWPHTLRVAGVTFLVVAALGHLPAAFALPAGLGDIAVGLAAPWVALGLQRGTGRKRAIWFNVLGIADLAIAVALGFLTGVGPDRLHVTPSSAPLALLPLALIPATAVPLATALHVVSLSRLRHDTRTVTRARTALAH